MRFFPGVADISDAEHRLPETALLRTVGGAAGCVVGAAVGRVLRQSFTAGGTHRLGSRRAKLTTRADLVVHIIQTPYPGNTSLEGLLTRAPRQLSLCHRIVRLMLKTWKAQANSDICRV